MKPRKTLSVYVLLIGVMGLSIVGGILVFQIFSASVKSQLTTAQREAIKPIDGTISQLVVENLEKRRPVFESELGSVTTPTPTQQVVATQPETPVLEQVENSTPSGELATPAATPKVQAQ